MTTAAVQYTPAVHLGDSLLVPCHQAVSAAIQFHEAIKRRVKGRLPEGMIQAVDMAKVQQSMIQQAVQSGCCISNLSVVPADRREVEFD